MKKEINAFFIGDEDPKDLDLPTRQELLVNMFFQVGEQVLGLTFDEMGSVAESLHMSHKLSRTIDESTLEAILNGGTLHDA